MYSPATPRQLGCSVTGETSRSKWVQDTHNYTLLLQRKRVKDAEAASPLRPMDLKRIKARHYDEELEVYRKEGQLHADHYRRPLF